MAYDTMSSGLDCRDMEKVEWCTKEIRERIPDIIEIDRNFEDDFYLYFWLKVGRFDVDKTETKIREVLLWRKENKSELAATLDYNPEIADNFKVYMDGKTKSGFLAWTGYAGIFKIKQTVATAGKDALIYHWLQLAAKAEKLIIQCNRDVQAGNVDTRHWPLRHKSWLILNCKSLCYSDILSRDVISVGIALVKMATIYFPALEGTLCFVNAGKVMDFVLKLLKPLLKNTNVDLIVYGSNEEQWLPVIHKYIDPDQIRTPFGGTMQYP